ncbi:putative reverse transcriptase domain-containing protein [Tanacetum coccineum]
MVTISSSSTKPIVPDPNIVSMLRVAQNLAAVANKCLLKQARIMPRMSQVLEMIGTRGVEEKEFQVSKYNEPIHYNQLLADLATIVEEETTSCIDTDGRVLEAAWTRKSLLSIMGYSQLADCNDLLFCLATQYRSFVQAMINEGIIAALAASDATRNGDDSHTSGTGARRPVQVARECTYPDFLKCQPLNFKGTDSRYPLACQVKFATCTLQGNALTWWNSHVKTTTPEAAHAMPWRTLKKMMTDKYCPRGEIKKLEFEMWNLKVKGKFDQVEKYVGGLPDTIHGSVMATKPKTMQDAIEFATELMDKKINTWAERQADNKRKSDDTARSNQNQQPNKRQNTGNSYAAQENGAGDLREAKPRVQLAFQEGLPKIEEQQQPGRNEVVAREEGRSKLRTTLIMAIPEDHLAKFHKMTDVKEMWNAIKSRFGGNDESKKMQKYILKQQFEGFSVSNTDGIHKGYERFQSLLSQLEIHGAGVSTEDANQKFLRSLPSAWLQVSLIMRNKPGMDSLSFDDLYNNLRVFENDVKGSTASSSNLQNIAFVSENTSSTKDVSTDYELNQCFPVATVPKTVR